MMKNHDNGRMQQLSISTINKITMHTIINYNISVPQALVQTLYYLKK